MRPRANADKRLPVCNHPPMQTWTLGKHSAVCPIALTASLLVSRWKTNVLWMVWRANDGGANRFNELLRRLPGINRGVLMRTLRELEEDGLLQRTEHGKRPAPVEYALTEKALALNGALAALAQWGRRYGTVTP